MIYTITFNPSLDYIVSSKDFELGKTNRTKEGVLFMYISIQHFLENGIEKLKEVELCQNLNN